MENDTIQIMGGIEKTPYEIYEKYEPYLKLWQSMDSIRTIWNTIKEDKDTFIDIHLMRLMSADISIMFKYFKEFREKTNDRRKI